MNIYIGNKIRFTAPVKEDAKILSAASHDFDYMEVLGGGGRVWTVESYEADIADHNKDGKAYEFFVRPLDSDRLIGRCSVYGCNFFNRSCLISLGIFDHDDRSKGYGTEMITMLLNHAFSVLGMHRVSLVVYEYNPRAYQLYKRLGFVEEGRMREKLFHNGKFYDEIVMSVLDYEWKGGC